jgi:hypothetical protein
MTFSLFTTSAIATGETQQGSSGNQQLAVQATSITTDVRPWCGWTALTAANSAITLAPAAGQDTVYDGDAIALEAIGQEFAIRVGPAGSAVAAGESFEALAADNCSWFANDQKNGVNVSTSLSGNSFTAVSDANTGEIPATDVTMNFDAEAGNPLTIDNTPVSCPRPVVTDGIEATAAAGEFSFSGSPLVVTATGASDNVVSMTAANTGTNNFCSWTSDYSISIPAGKKPLFGDSTYTFTGPTITNTMVYSRTP